MSQQESRASVVLSEIRMQAPLIGVGIEIVDSWVENDLVICVVYQSQFTDGLHGLRREVETDVPIEAVVKDIVWLDLGEPLGKEADGLTRDQDGILWWFGTDLEWRYAARKARGHWA
jgi:hypothetical protein